MLGYAISTEKNVNWTLFTDSSSGFSSCPENIAHVLALVKLEFERIFGSDVVNSRPSLSVVYSPDEPIVFRAHHLMFLSSSGPYYLQHIYQFSHELCHFMSAFEVCLPYRWFEETLCETMSWFILHQISLHAKTDHIHELGPLYGSVIDKYIEDSQAKRDIISVPSLSAYISALLPHLQQDCYARAINAAVAYELYPLFRDNPSLWRIVLHLHELRPDFSLEEAVAFLCSASSVPPTVSRQLRRLLCQ